MSLQDVHHLLWDTGQYLLSMLVVQIGTMKCFYCPQTKRLWSLGIHCPPMIKFFCRTSTLILVRGQFATCVFTLHAPVRSSAALLQAPHCQPPNQWILGCRCLWVLQLCLVQPRLWPQSQWNLGLWSLRCLLQSLLLPPQGLPEGLLHTQPAHHNQKVCAKPLHLDTLKKAKQPRVLKTIIIAQRVEK